MSLDLYIGKLDKLTWGFRIEKLQEHEDDKAIWHVMFINPRNKTWYFQSDYDLATALRKAIERLETYPP